LNREVGVIIQYLKQKICRKESYTNGLHGKEEENTLILRTLRRVMSSFRVYGEILFPIYESKTLTRMRTEIVVFVETD
jgi:hypothetical protein